MLRIDQHPQGCTVSAYVTDALGTPMQLVTPKGETLWQAQPDDWAAVTNERGTASQPIRFQGQWYDEESGLYYNRHRYYDPQQGRYISQDPIGLKGGRNLYGYVSNPTGMVDPMGLSPQVRTLFVAGQKAEKLRGQAWCASQYIATVRSVSQLPPIVDQHIAMAEEARASQVRGCESDKDNRERLGLPYEGEYNSCLDQVGRSYQERILEITREDISRHSGVDDQLNDIYRSCLEPSFGDIETPRERR